MKPRPVCRYEPKCYRHNADHLAEFSHPSREGAVPSRTESTTGSVPHHPKRTPFVPTVTSGTTAAEPYLIDDEPEPSAARTVVPVARVTSPPTPASPAPVPDDGFPTRPSPLTGDDPDVIFEMKHPVAVIEAILATCRAHPAVDKAAAASPVRDRLLGALGPHITLCGPFAVLAHKVVHECERFAFESDIDKWTRWRMPRQSPEAQSIALLSPQCVSALVGATAADTEGRHDRVDGDVEPGVLCIHRDDPAESPVGITVVHGAGGRRETLLGDNLRQVLEYALQRVLSDAGDDARATYLSQYPAAAVMCKDTIPRPNLAQLNRARLGKGPKKGSNVYCGRTFSGIGFSAPYDFETEIGYREAMMDKPKLKRTLQTLAHGEALAPKARDELDEQLRFADIANDESDFGLNLELGLDFLFYAPLKSEKRGGEVTRHAVRILSVAYELLMRDLYAHILKCQATMHLAA